MSILGAPGLAFKPRVALEIEQVEALECLKKREKVLISLTMASLEGKENKLVWLRRGMLFKIVP